MCDEWQDEKTSEEKSEKGKSEWWNIIEGPFINREGGAPNDIGSDETENSDTDFGSHGISIWYFV